jgi:flagellar biosynthesis/type III secretory pathway M-ring protein FliF/YscJ
MQRVYVSIKKESGYPKTFHSALVVILSFVIFTIVAFLMRGAFNGQREELIEKLKKEREVAQLNENLKIDLAGIMRRRYIELKAKERLGLKMPKEGEVIILRHE